ELDGLGHEARADLGQAAGGGRPVDIGDGATLPAHRVVVAGGAGLEAGGAPRGVDPTGEADALEGGEHVVDRLGRDAPEAVAHRGGDLVDPPVPRRVAQLGE